MKKLFLLSLALIAFATTCAQSLPKVQLSSVKLPANVKIDGKANEWDNKFQAYNPATELFYTIANDDKRLYLIFQANNPKTYGVVNRIVSGGITFTVVNKNVKGNSGISVTYPAKENSQTQLFSFIDDKGATIIASDSLREANNLRLEKNLKMIKVSGIKGLDTISVYNEAGIEAAAKFDAKNNFIIELCIPIELLRNQINKNNISYQISINGGKVPLMTIKKEKTEASGSNDPEYAKYRDDITSAVNKMNTLFTASTYFKGEYNLAK